MDNVFDDPNFAKAAQDAVSQTTEPPTAQDSTEAVEVTQPLVVAQEKSQEQQKHALEDIAMSEEQMSQEMQRIGAATSAMMSANPEDVKVTTEEVRLGLTGEAATQARDMFAQAAQELAEREAKKAADAEAQPTVETTQSQPVVTENVGPVLPTKTPGTAIDQQDIGGGLIIENKKQEAPMPKEFKHMQQYLQNMEEDFNDPHAVQLRKNVAFLDPTQLSAEELKEVDPALMKHAATKMLGAEAAQKMVQERLGIEPVTEEKEDENKLTDRESAEKRVEDFNKAIIVIDKLNSDKIGLTAEEHNKLERVEKIRLEEVQKVDIKTIKKRKNPAGSVKKVLQRKVDRYRQHTVPSLISGLVFTMNGASPQEVMNLSQDDENGAVRQQSRWSFIHEKLADTSIGKLKYDDFLKHVAQSDQDLFIYGVLCSTFTENDSIRLTCTNPKCVNAEGQPNEYLHKYNPRDLLRIEDLTEENMLKLKKYTEAYNTLDDALIAHQESDLMQTDGFVLPDSGYIFEVQIQSAYDFLNKTLTAVNSDTLDPKYAQAAVISTAVRSCLIPSIGDNGEEIHDEYTETEDLCEIIYELSSKDLVILSEMISRKTEGRNFQFGLVNMECPHCGKVTDVEYIDDVGKLLFYHNSTSLNIEVE